MRHPPFFYIQSASSSEGNNYGVFVGRGKLIRSSTSRFLFGLQKSLQSLLLNLLALFLSKFYFFGPEISSSSRLCSPHPLPERHLPPFPLSLPTLLVPPSPILRQSRLRIAGIIKINLTDRSLYKGPYPPVEPRYSSEPLHFLKQSFRFFLNVLGGARRRETT